MVFWLVYRASRGFGWCIGLDLVSVGTSSLGLVLVGISSLDLVLVLVSCPILALYFYVELWLSKPGCSKIKMRSTKTT